MTTIAPVIAFNAFESQLSTLCLNEFPCGIGSWRGVSSNRRPHLQEGNVSDTFSVTLKDYGAQLEKTETLEELTTAKRSPWKLDYSWSDEAKKLREIAVRSPWLIDEPFVLSHFKTMRIVDKGVTEVDEQFLKFANLLELSLSANFIRNINSRCLPTSLKVLELCGNQISNLADLCERPPLLHHLGLGYNQLTLLDDYVTAEYWPQLLSLDLSHNNLVDLMDIIKKLQTLPRLRNLVLNGNPLALVAGYRGYTIDNIRQLDFLDDVAISADEKHHFKGLARRKEYILDECKLHLGVDFIRGVPMPEEMQYPDEQPEFPVVTRKYFVQFEYLEDKSANAEVFQIMHDDQFSLLTSTQQTEDVTPYDTARESIAQSVEQPRQEGRVGQDAIYVSQDLDTTRDDQTVQSLNIPPASEVTVTQTNQLSVEGDLTSRLSCAGNEDAKDGDVTSRDIPIRLAPIKSDSSTWLENMEINWRSTVVRDDLLGMRNFLKQGMNVAVLEEKVLSFPPEPPEEKDNHGTTGKGGKDSKGKTDKKKDEKGKDNTKDAKNKKGQKAGGKADEVKKKKKKGQPEIELVHLPAEYTTLATFHIPLEDFLDKNPEYDNIFTYDGLIETARKPPTVASSHKKDGKKDAKDKKGSAKKKDAKDKDNRKSAKGDKKGDKDAKGKAKQSGSEEEEEPPPPPPPLQFHVSLKLHQWKTARDSLLEEQEVNKQHSETSNH